jgi:hypothetical protein
MGKTGMGKSIHALIASIAGVALLLFQFGCATARPAQPPSVSEDARAQIRTVGIVSAENITDVKIQEPRGKWTGFWSGAGEGALNVMGGMGSAGGNCQGIGCGLIVIIVAGAAAVGGIVGGIMGAIQGVPAEEKQKAGEAIETALKDLKIDETLADCILDEGLIRTPHDFMLVEKTGTGSAEKKVTYDREANQGIDTVLEIRAVEFGLMGQSKADPLLSFYMNADIRLIRTADNIELYHYPFKYCSRISPQFSEWGRDNARLFTKEFGLSAQNICEQIVKTLF